MIVGMSRRICVELYKALAALRPAWHDDSDEKGAVVGPLGGDEAVKLTEEQVRHVARLARLALSADELARYGSQLSAILDAVDSLSQVDTTGVPPTSVIGAAAAHLREDVVAGELGAQVALANAPQIDDSSFAIPKVIE